MTSLRLIKMVLTVRDFEHQDPSGASGDAFWKSTLSGVVFPKHISQRFPLDCNTPIRFPDLISGSLRHLLGSGVSFQTKKTIL